MEYQHEQHTVHLIVYHIIWCPKRRRKILNGPVYDRLKEIIEQVADENDWQILELAIQPDHVHLFLRANPYTLPTDIARLIKGRSSHHMRKEFPHLAKMPSLWTRSTFYSTAGNGRSDTIAKYREKQSRDEEHMLVYEYKLDSSKKQSAAIDEAIRVVQFIRNKSLRLWMDNRGTSKNDLQTNCALLAKEYLFVSRLNSQARQASADRAWFAISRFYDNCKSKKPGKKGYPQFQHDTRSVEYKTTGWKLDPDGRHITFTDGCGIGRLRLIGTRDIEMFPVRDIKRVRIVRRADGYSVQFMVKAERQIEHIPSGKEIGIDVGLKSFLTDSEGNAVANPRHYRKAEKRLKRLQRRLSKKQKKSANRKKARKALAKHHLKVQRQREDFARKQANTYVSSSDLIAYEDLQIKHMVRNRKLAKSIHDAGWGSFLQWLNYYAFLHNIPVIAVTPHYTSQNCSACGTLVKKTLSVRTHICTSCGVVLDRDHNAALNILEKARTVGHTGTHGKP